MTRSRFVEERFAHWRTARCVSFETAGVRALADAEAAEAAGVKWEPEDPEEPAEPNFVYLPRGLVAVRPVPGQNDWRLPTHSELTAVVLWWQQGPALRTMLEGIEAEASSAVFSRPVYRGLAATLRSALKVREVR